jgi:CHAT domain-containing protein
VSTPAKRGIRAPVRCCFGLLLCAGFASGATDSFDRLVEQGRAQLRQGQYLMAQDTLLAARRTAATPDQEAEADGMLGLAQYRMHHAPQAEELLRKAIGTGLGNPRDRARWLDVLAELQADRGSFDEAGRLYAEALPLAGDDRRLRLHIRLEQAGLLPPAQRLAELARIRTAIDAIPNPEDRASTLIRLANLARDSGGGGLPLAYDSLERARQAAGQQPRQRAEALAGLARLYESQGRGEEALRLNGQAIQAAREVDAHDLLLELEWRQGRLCRDLKRMPEALAAYQRAVDHIEAIRQDIPVEYQNGRSSFRETLEPVYMGLADLLLAQAARETGENKAPLLRHARETLELVKQSELEDFFGARCAVQTSRATLLESVEARTAVIYPIILPERLELLVSVGGEIQQYTRPVTADSLRFAALALAKSLRNGYGDVKTHARQLHDWLIVPIEAGLRRHRVQTLVIVPDGVLRLIPLAALHDGEHYLIERYALATSPGLTLFEPSPLARHAPKTLLAGMSEPGPVIERLPPALLAGMAGADSRGLGGEGPFRSRALPLNRADAGTPWNQGRGKADPEAREKKDPAFWQAVKKRLSLPGVEREIEGVRQRVPNTLLMNEDFTVDRLKQQLVREPYSMVHIASHGVFGRTAETSFIMAYDGTINIDELDRLLKSDKFRRQPVELLTLSACQTAEGDDRAPLGLSGIALKARVRSALGTLWPVSDEAAARLMPLFYQSLLQPGTSKVEALRQAQLALLKDKRLEHPFFWSPFILMGNWL